MGGTIKRDKARTQPRMVALVRVVGTVQWWEVYKVWVPRVHAQV